MGRLLVRQCLDPFQRHVGQVPGVAWFLGVAADSPSYFRKGTGRAGRLPPPSNRSHKMRLADMEALAQVNTADILILHDFLGIAIHEDRSVMQDISSINDLQGFAHVMIGDQDA